MSTAAVIPQPHYRTQSVPATHKQRVPAIEFFRYAASLAVLWIHIDHDLASLASVQPARLAVPFFCALSGYLAIGSILKNPSQTFFGFARNRLIRLYLPFIAWSCIYWLFKVAKNRWLPNQPSDLPGWEFFAVGGAYHLWFFPFIAAGSMLAYAIANARKWESAVGYLPTLLFATGAAIAFAPNPCDPSQAWSYMWDAMASLLWGIGIGYLAYHPSEHAIETRAKLSWMRPWAFALAIGGAWLSIWSTCRFGRSNFIEGLGGVSILLACLFFPAQSSVGGSWNGERIAAIATQLGSISMGVYCVHLLILKVIESIVTKCQLPDGAMPEIAIWIATALISTSVAWCLSQSSRTRWLVT